MFLLSVKLQGITLKLSPGSKVALVGPSGGGKVTLISFLNFLKFLSTFFFHGKHIALGIILP